MKPESSNNSAALRRAAEARLSNLRRDICILVLGVNCSGCPDRWTRDTFRGPCREPAGRTRSPEPRLIGWATELAGRR